MTDKDARLLIERMEGCKKCAEVTCDYLIRYLPNINLTPPIHREEENNYRQYWIGVKHEIHNYER